MDDPHGAGMTRSLALRRLPLAVALCVLLAACVDSVAIRQSWRDTAYAGPRFERLLVVGFGEDGASRRVFEDEFVRALRAAGVAATASYTLVPGLSGSDLPKVREALTRSGADAVLATRLVGVDKRMHVHPAQPVFVPSIGYRRGFYGYYSAVIVSPPTTYQYEIVTLETSLWNAKGDALVWSGTSESFAPDDARLAAGELARTVIAALRGQGLL